MNERSYVMLLSSLKGQSVLETALELDVVIKYVVIVRDLNVKEDYSHNIAELCKANKITFTYNINNINFEKNDIVLAVSWKRMLHNLEKKLIIFHDSLLPRYRGFAPLVNMLINGEEKLGVSVLFAGDNYDTGPILFQDEIEISYPLKIVDAINLISKVYKKLAKRLFTSKVAPLKIEGVRQLEKDATYSLWRDDEDYKILWDKSAAQILRHIHAVSYPYLGAQTISKELKIRIFDAEIVQDVNIENRQPGKVIFNEAGYPVVTCGEGLLKILDASIEGDLNTQNFVPTSKLKFRFSY